MDIKLNDRIVHIIPRNVCLLKHVPAIVAAVLTYKKRHSAVLSEEELVAIKAAIMANEKTATCYSSA